MNAAHVHVHADSFSGQIRPNDTTVYSTNSAQTQEQSRKPLEWIETLLKHHVTWMTTTPSSNTPAAIRMHASYSCIVSQPAMYVSCVGARRGFTAHALPHSSCEHDVRKSMYNRSAWGKPFLRTKYWPFSNLNRTNAAPRVRTSGPASWWGPVTTQPILPCRTSSIDKCSRSWLCDHGFATPTKYHQIPLNHYILTTKYH
jgi:hypothetical protein